MSIKMESENDIIATRLVQFLASEGMTAMKFAEIMEIQPSNVSHFMKGRNKPNFDFLSRFFLRFPEINPDWFINGVGEMYRPGRVQSTGDTSPKPQSQIPQDLFSYDDSPIQQPEPAAPQPYQPLFPQPEPVASQPSVMEPVAPQSYQPTFQQPEPSAPQPYQPSFQQPELAAPQPQEYRQPEPVASQPSVTESAAPQQQEYRQPESAVSQPSVIEPVEPQEYRQPEPAASQPSVTERVTPQQQEYQLISTQPAESVAPQAQESLTSRQTSVEPETSGQDRQPQDCHESSKQTDEKPKAEITRIVMFYDDRTFVEYSSK